MRQHFWSYLAVWAIACTTVHAAPRYNHGDEGEFGNPEFWGSRSAVFTWSSLDQAFSARFTSFENVTIDRAFLKFSLASSGAMATIGIQADDGTGKPSGVFLADTGSIAVSDGVFVGAFTSSVNLEDGKVYHLVVEPQSFGSGTQLRMLGSSVNNLVRPYDRALDPMMNTMTRSATGVWSEGPRDPFFAFANGSDSNIVAGPGQPYDHTFASGNRVIHTTAVTAKGQQFMITDKEVPLGAAIWVDRITLVAATDDDPTSPLIITIRDSTGNELARASIAPTDPGNGGPWADGTTTWTLKLDRIAKLEQGQTYLLATQMTGSGEYRFAASRTFDATYPTNWGADTFAYVVRSTDGWSTWSLDSSTADMRFGLLGQVFMPEPSSAACLIVILAGVVVRRRSRPLAA